MKPKRSRLAPVFAIASAAALALSGCPADPAQPATTPSTASEETSSWMETTYRDHPEITLGSILIPGTHDSGSFGIDVIQPCSNTVIAGSAVPVVALRDAEPCMLAGFSRAQDVDLKAQLESGIRYLDMRIGVPQNQVIKATGGPIPAPSDPLAVPLVTHHTVVSAPLKDSLDGILDFAQAHPKEQVILDFQHVNLPEDPNVAAYYKSVLNSYLHSYVPPGREGAVPVCDRAWSTDAIPVDDADLSSQVSFGDAWKAGRNLIVLADPQGLPTTPCYRNRDRGILSQWPKTQSPQISATYNKIELQQRQAKLAAKPPECNGTQSIGANADGSPKTGTQAANWCGFFVSQMQLSVGNKTYATCVLDPRPNCSLFSLALDVNDSIGKQMVDWSKDGLPTNVVIADFFNYAKPSIVGALLERNRETAAAVTG